MSKSDTPSDVSQLKKHLGFLVDSVSMTVSAPAQKLEDIVLLTRTTLISPPYSARQLARVLGKLISLHPALGPIVMVLSRLAQTELAAFTDSHGWSALLTLSQEAVDALLLLIDSLFALNGYPVRNESTATPLSAVLDHLDSSEDRPVFGMPSDATIVASDASSSAPVSYTHLTLPTTPYV